MTYHRNVIRANGRLTLWMMKGTTFQLTGKERVVLALDWMCPSEIIKLTAKPLLLKRLITPFVPDYVLGQYVINDPAGIRSHPYSTSA